MMTGLWEFVFVFFFSPKAQSKIMRTNKLDTVPKSKEKTATTTVLKHADMHTEQLSPSLHLRKTNSFSQFSVPTLL